MVVIGEDEFNDLQADAETDVELISTKKFRQINPYTGEIAKFNMDSWFGREVNVPNLSEDAVKAWLDWFEQAFPEQFKRNDTANIKIESAPYIGERPLFFQDQEAMQKTLDFAAAAEARMIDTEIATKKKRKDRLRLFDNCLREFLNTEYFGNYKIKYDK